MEPNPLGDLLHAARELWADGLAATPSNLHAAAVGLACDWYRNTEAVEDHAHAGGPWTDEDMLRWNARATEACLRALHDVATASGEGMVERRLADLFDELLAQLPNTSARRSLQEEKGNAPNVAALWVRVNGIGNWLAKLTHALNYPHDWWGVPGYTAIVDQFCALTPGPPEPETFRPRMLHTPWDLTDAQAAFVCTHRYDVGR